MHRQQNLSADDRTAMQDTAPEVLYVIYHEISDYLRAEHRSFRTSRLNFLRNILCKHGRASTK